MQYLTNSNRAKCKKIFICLFLIIVVQLVLEYKCTTRKQNIVYVPKNITEAEQVCKKWKTSDEILLNSNTKPLFNFEKSKYLIPWLYNGPNNQLFGLRQAVYVAIALRRVLVMPLFFKHFMETDENNQRVKSKIDASQR